MGSCCSSLKCSDHFIISPFSLSDESHLEVKSYERSQRDQSKGQQSDTFPLEFVTEAVACFIIVGQLFLPLNPGDVAQPAEGLHSVPEAVGSVSSTTYTG